MELGGQLRNVTVPGVGPARGRELVIPNAELKLMGQGPRDQWISGSMDCWMGEGETGRGTWHKLRQERHAYSHDVASAAVKLRQERHGAVGLGANAEPLPGRYMPLLKELGTVRLSR